MILFGVTQRSNHLIIFRAGAVLAFLVLWELGSRSIGSPLFPSFVVVCDDLVELALDPRAWTHFGLTFGRGLVGICISGVAALSLGALAAKRAYFREALMPLVTSLQASPTILWISLLLVWLGTEGQAPVLMAVVVSFPVLFFNVLQGVQSLNTQLCEMLDFYDVRSWRRWRFVILPGVLSHVSAGLSFCLGVSWKVVTTAEFIGSERGIGAELHWAYRDLNIERMFSWGLILVALGLIVEHLISGTLRERAARISTAS